MIMKLVRGVCCKGSSRSLAALDDDACTIREPCPEEACVDDASQTTPVHPWQQAAKNLIKADITTTATTPKKQPNGPGNIKNVPSTTSLDSPTERVADLPSM